MSSNEILIQCQAKVSYFLYIIILNSLFKFLFSLIRTVFSNAVWITIFETSDAKKTIWALDMSQIKSTVLRLVRSFCQIHLIL